MSAHCLSGASGMVRRVCLLSFAGQYWRMKVRPAFRQCGNRLCTRHHLKELDEDMMRFQPFQRSGIITIGTL
ncbi:MAG: hypothetical protein ABF932_11590 [Gluconobacter potus]|uniref:Transposase n=1 Tax=Gluconobacter potus TaxID=2724927 RepID=A0ABR9YNI1_9PROT|nr:MULTISPECIES: hypothetical protein [Gluconobacter]MBF0865050.1 hypothetical protein [Gluconobacter sp. R71656]MBF0868205.1 hypothetical protein [Gluconobacter sp. R75628]MBF0874187.1 hypothetical protein [Gluconobacter sp. R75629]MBF0883164.1 hypothetical protein [Gluconobacter potus]